MRIFTKLVLAAAALSLVAMPVCARVENLPHVVVGRPVTPGVALSPAFTREQGQLFDQYLRELAGLSSTDAPEFAPFCRRWLDTFTKVLEADPRPELELVLRRICVALAHGCKDWKAVEDLAGWLAEEESDEVSRIIARSWLIAVIKVRAAETGAQEDLLAVATAAREFIASFKPEGSDLPEVPSDTLTIYVGSAYSTWINALRRIGALDQAASVGWEAARFVGRIGGGRSTTIGRVFPGDYVARNAAIDAIRADSVDLAFDILASIDELRLGELSSADHLVQVFSQLGRTVHVEQLLSRWIRSDRADELKIEILPLYVENFIDTDSDRGWTADLLSIARRLVSDRVAPAVAKRDQADQEDRARREAAGQHNSARSSVVGVASSLACRIRAAWMKLASLDGVNDEVVEASRAVLDTCGEIPASTDALLWLQAAEQMEAP